MSLMRPEDKHSEVWARLRVLIDKQIEDHRRALETAQDFTVVARHQASIKSLKKVISEVEPAPAMPIVEPERTTKKNSGIELSGY